MVQKARALIVYQSTKVSKSPIQIIIQVILTEGLKNIWICLYLGLTLTHPPLESDSAPHTQATSTSRAILGLTAATHHCHQQLTHPTASAATHHCHQWWLAVVGGVG